MILKRLYDEKLAQASYLVGCARTGEAIVVDPNRDLASYLQAAAQEGVRIAGVTETHIHADYLSGARELAVVTGATLYLSHEGDADWKYAYAAAAGATLLRHGDTIRLGAVRLDVLKTPGHTPEHISFLITDEAASTEPVGLLSGDFVFVGDVGRPDLLETAAGVQGTMEQGARTLYRSLRSTDALPPHVLLWPGHGAGSACGKSLGAVPVSSLGYERASNWAFKAQSEEAFVREVLAGQPAPPMYFATMKRLNKEGPPLLGGLRLPPRLTDPERIPELIAGGSVVIDLRETEPFAQGHIPGTLHLPQYRNFITWAGSVLPYDRDLHLIAPSEASARQAVRDLAMIGLDRVAGWSGEEILPAYEREVGPLRSIRQVRAASLQGSASDAMIVDVRNPAEYEAGHVEGARLAPLARLPEQAAALPKDRPLIVYCRTGVRSPIAVSALQRLGFEQVANVEDGYVGYEAARMLQAAGR